MSVNKAILVGHLGRDPEVRQTQSGTSVANFTLATNDRVKDKTGTWQDKTEWHKVVAFGTTADNIGKYLRKGSRVYIEGKMQTRSWEKNGATQYTTEVIVSDLQFLDKAGAQRDEPVQGYTQPSTTIEDEDIPF